MVLGPALTLTAYLVGSVLFAVVVARRAGVDLREVGSGNVGATNAGRALGKRLGRVVMLLDVLKGFVPAAAAAILLGPYDPWAAATGVAAVAGHIAPVWFKFRGGKGAATGAGVLLGLVPPAGLGALVAFVALKKLTRRASVGSLGGAAVGVAVTAVLCRATWPTAMASAVLVLVLIRHVDNVRRLLRGEEPPS